MARQGNWSNTLLRAICLTLLAVLLSRTTWAFARFEPQDAGWMEVPRGMITAWAAAEIENSMPISAGPSFLDGKVLIGCMQRGGVAGVVGELDDRFGSYTAKSLDRFRLDGGKMMFRFVVDDERTLWQIDCCAQAVTDLNQYELVPFVEPLRMDSWTASGWAKTRPMNWSN